MNNFQITNLADATYVSKVGNDSNFGDADNPLATPANALNLVIGAGQYKGVFNFNLASNRFVYGDGLVWFDITANVTTRATIGDITLIDINYNLNNYNLLLGNVLVTTTFLNSIIKNGMLIGKGVFNQSILDNIIFNGTEISTFDKTTIVNSIINFQGNMTSTYVDENTEITWNNINVADFRGNNFMGRIIYNNNTYELKKNRSGINIVDRINNGIFDIIDILPNVYQTNFSQNPEVIANYNLVSENSPNLVSGVLEANIGNSKVSTTINVNNLLSTTNLTLGNNDLYLNVNQNTGEIITNPLKIAPFPILLDSIDLTALFNYNSDFLNATFENNNVFSNNNFLNGAGSNPNRLTYQMRWTTSVNEPINFDNDGHTTLNEYLTFEQFKIPTISSTILSPNKVGNGNPLFELSQAERIRGNWIQIKLIANSGLGN